MKENKTPIESFFLSYCFDDEKFVQRVNYVLSQQPQVETYCYANNARHGKWRTQIADAINERGIFIFFWGRRFGDTQAQEFDEALKANKKLVIVALPGREVEPRIQDEHTGLIKKLRQYAAVIVPDMEEEGGFATAKGIIEKIVKQWVDVDGLPVGYPFDYEKRIIDEYVAGNGTLSAKRIREGCPETWPRVYRKPTTGENPIGEEDLGAYRDWDKQANSTKESVVYAAALSSSGANKLVELDLSFPEAGPRKYLSFPVKGAGVTVGILVSGGIAPGINSVIAGIVERHSLYAEKGHWDQNIIGYIEGFKALSERGPGIIPEKIELTKENVEKHAHLGGSVLPTARADKLVDLSHPADRALKLKKVVHALENDGIQILYVIGGDGSMRAAHAISNVAKREEIDLSVVAIPKTMDNDILWVWQSFGFLSAVEWAKDAIRQLYTEVTSNPRLSVIQLFGSDSGFVVSHAALASGVCDLVLIPEVEFCLKDVEQYITDIVVSRRGKGRPGGAVPFGIILVSETAIPKDVKDYLPMMKGLLTTDEMEEIENFEREGRRVVGQTPDELRQGGLKVIKYVLQNAIREKSAVDPYWAEFRVFTNEPRHLIRSIPPSSSDIIFGNRLGTLAVDCAMSGYSDFMISQWLTEYVMVPLGLVVLGRKRIPESGIFWKTVRDNTGQPDSLCSA